MSKEWLEEIERHAEHKSIMPMYPMHDRPIKNTTSIRTKDYDWLTKQAERAQELEKNLEKYRNGFELQLQINNSIKKKNKRYREIINYVMKTKPSHYSNMYELLDDIKFVINETLEGESDE